MTSVVETFRYFSLGSPWVSYKPVFEQVATFPIGYARTHLNVTRHFHPNSEQTGTTPAAFDKPASARYGLLTSLNPWSR